MHRRKILIQLGIVLTILTLVGTQCVWAEFTTDFLVKVSGDSPFPPTCGDFPGTIPEPGVVFSSSEVEPWDVATKGHILDITA